MGRTLYNYLLSYHKNQLSTFQIHAAWDGSQPACFQWLIDLKVLPENSNLSDLLIAWQ